VNEQARRNIPAVWQDREPADAKALLLAEATGLAFLLEAAAELRGGDHHGRSSVRRNVCTFARAGAMVPPP
jgi:hypothetical protein